MRHHSVFLSGFCSLGVHRVSLASRRGSVTVLAVVISTIGGQGNGSLLLSKTALMKLSKEGYLLNADTYCFMWRLYLSLA